MNEKRLSPDRFQHLPYRTRSYDLSKYGRSAKEPQ